MGPRLRSAVPRRLEPVSRSPQPALASLAASLPRLCAGRLLRCPRESASIVARARSCWRRCSSSKSREFATCSHFRSAAARVGGRSVRSEPSRVRIGTARPFEVECPTQRSVERQSDCSRNLARGMMWRQAEASTRQHAGLEALNHSARDRFEIGHSSVEGKTRRDLLEQIYSWISKGFDPQGSSGCQGVSRRAGQEPTMRSTVP